MTVSYLEIERPEQFAELPNACTDLILWIVWDTVYEPGSFLHMYGQHSHLVQHIEQEWANDNRRLVIANVCLDLPNLKPVVTANGVTTLPTYVFTKNGDSFVPDKSLCKICAKNVSPCQGYIGNDLAKLEALQQHISNVLHQVIVQLI